MTASTTRGSKPRGESQDIQAVVIPEGEHPLRERDIDKEALKVLYRLRDAGFSGYLVGGGVRDLYLGNRPKDFDISTNARPGQLRKLFRNSRTIGRRFRLVQVFFHGNKIIEVSTLRCRSEYDINDPDKVLPANNTFGTLEEDAFRRDLTINSLFYEIENKTIIDYVGGVQDLDNGIIRIVGEPERRITRDPVRMMRVIRHAARNGFTIDPNTWKALVAERNKLDLCPPSRIRDELLKDLHSGNSRLWAEVALKSGIFVALFPFYGEMLAAKNGGKLEQELLAILAVVDRLYAEKVDGGRVVMADHFLFACVLFPWADRRFDLMNQDVKGPAYNRLAREIRVELDEAFSNRLNLKRMAKDAITTLFVNMPGFHLNHGKNSWSVRLRKKSYFTECSRFYGIYQEAVGKEAVDISLFVEKGSSPYSVQRTVRTGRGGKRRFHPAFTSRSQGVFGLRKG